MTLSVERPPSSGLEPETLTISALECRAAQGWFGYSQRAAPTGSDMPSWGHLLPHHYWDTAATRADTSRWSLAKEGDRVNATCKSSALKKPA